MKKLYFVKREVIASSLKQALTAKGSVYEVVLAAENQWPQNKQKAPGFNDKTNVQKNS